MTTRVEFRNPHTNSAGLRVREVTITDGRITIVEGVPPLDMTPGQNGARRVHGGVFLLVEPLPGTPAEKPHLPHEPVEA